MTAARCTNLISRYHGDSHWRRASMIIAVMGRSALRAAIDLATAAIEHFGAELGFLLLARVDRNRVLEGMSVSVSVDLVGRRIIIKEIQYCKINNYVLKQKL